MRLCKTEHLADPKVKEEGGLGVPALLRVGGGIANWEYG